MSRLPRIAQSLEMEQENIPSLKRKAEDDDLFKFTSKVPALGNGSRPIKPLPGTSEVSNGAPTTRSRAPLVNTTAANSGIVPPSKFKRSTSAPPKNTKLPHTQTNNITIRNRIPSAGRIGAPQRVPMQDDRLKKLQEQMAGMEAARLADSARLAADMEAERFKVSELQSNHQQLSSQLTQARTIEIETRRNAAQLSDEIDSLRQKHRREVMELELDRSRLEREVRSLKDEILTNEQDLRRERDVIASLKGGLAQQQTENIALSARINAIQAVSGNIQGHLDNANEQIRRLEDEAEGERRRAARLEDELQEAESLRRKLHNTIQELKGNIRVFCRVRPPLLPTNEDETDKIANIQYPDGRDHREIQLSSVSESATGQERKEQWSFAFDRVFQPPSSQHDVFEEISQLVQSCTDGYNVCIFAYGQTGSGKSFTMEGGPTVETQGMIPRAVQKVFEVTESLRPKGWEYTMEGQFLEIYNETLNDLLGKHEFDKKKHEIKHDKGSTRVTDVVIVPLTSPTQVRVLLQQAQSRRSVASTLMNERSSRSHSVFTLRISGVNAHTGESCEGSLNLVDLAGSERLNSSGAGADKDRLKETQSINKSLSALADVIGALGEKSERGDKHIPYRNSKLTYLLQNSLSGHSKTLMVLNVSPLSAHLGETLCSLRFATKVNNTTIGTARKQARIVS